LDEGCPGRDTGPAYQFLPWWRRVLGGAELGGRSDLPQRGGEAEGAEIEGLTLGWRCSLDSF